MIKEILKITSSGICLPFSGMILRFKIRVKQIHSILNISYSENEIVGISKNHSLPCFSYT